jgi:hypothetical protein
MPLQSKITTKEDNINKSIVSRNHFDIINCIMKKIFSIIMVMALCSISFVSAKKKAESQNLEIDYSTLTAETVVELIPGARYEFLFINLPENITSTQLKKRFSGKFVNVRGKREKVESATSSHRVRMKKANVGFEGKVRLKLYEKLANSDDDSNDDSNDDNSSLTKRTNDNNNNDNVLVDTIEFTITIPEPEVES